MLEERLAATQPPPVLLGDPMRIDGPIAGRNEDRFVGREKESACARAAVDAARNGVGSVILVSGEAGIGKTRFALEVSREARTRDLEVVWGRCWEGGGAPPYWPWIEVVRQLLRDPGAGLHAALGRHARQLARLVPEALPGTEAATTASDPDSGRFLLFDAVAAALRLASTRRPMVVVVDDLHAADRASALLLAFLARTLKDCGIVLIGTYRDAQAHALTDLVDALGELARDATRIALQGLDPGDVREVLAGLQGSPPADGLVDRIQRITDGNPFFVREIARLLASDPAGGGAAAGFTIPEGIRETVRQRLEPLAPAVRSMLATAAVAGREFDALVVSRAAGLETVDFLELIEPAIAHAILDVVPEDSARFSFRHALIRETIYDDLAHAARIRLHGDVRDALEQLSTAAPDRYVAALAHHALAAAPAGDDDRFVAHGIRAARVALQRMAFEESVHLYERTLDALIYARPDERRRCELLLGLGEAKEWANDQRGSRVVIEQAAAIARSLGAPELLARAALAVGGIEALKATAVSRCETAASLIHEALSLASGIDAPTHARLRSRLALHLMTSGDRDRARSESAAAVAEARAAGDRDTLAHALIAQHSVLLGPDHLAERTSIASELLLLASALGNRDFEMRGHALRVVNALERGDITTVEEATDRHYQLAEQTQDPFERWANVLCRSARALLVGDFNSALSCARRGFDLAQTVPGPHAFEINGPLAYAAQLILIEDTKGGPLPEPGPLDILRTKFHEVPAWQAARLLIITRLGLIDEVRRELDRLMAHNFANSERYGTWLVAMSILSEAAALVEDRDLAAELYPKLLPYSHHNITASFVACRGSVSRYLGLLAATMHKRDAARRHFEDALAMNRRMGASPHVAATLYDFCVVLRSQDEHLQATTLCREALHIAKSLGMDSLAIRCETHLTRRESSSTARRARDFELSKRGAFWSLTYADREVVVRDRKGMHYIAELLRHPDRDVHTRDLRALFNPVQSAAGDHRSGSAGTRRQSDTHAAAFSESLVDPKARRAYQRRLAELEDEMEAAVRGGDPEEIATLREEHAALSRELARVTGLGGRTRRSDDAERVRLAVTRAIRKSLVDIVNSAPDVGSVLARRIRTGFTCRYSSTDAED